MSKSNLKSLTKHPALIFPSFILLLFQLTKNVLADCSLGAQGTDKNPLGVICPPAGIPTEAASVGSLITFGIKTLIFVGFLLAFIYLLIGGISYITSNGEPAKTAAAQKKIIFAVVGLVVIILAFSILTLIEKVFSLSTGSLTSPQLPF